MKKKLLFLCLSLVLALSLVACGSDKTSEDTSKNESTQAMDKNTDNKDGEVDNENLGDSLKAIKEKGKLVVGTSADYPPYEFKALVDGKQKIVGFDIDIAKKIADKLGVDMEVKDMDFKVLIPTLQSGQLDIVIAGLNPSPDREKAIGLSNSYYDATQTIIVNKDNIDNYKTMDDLKGKIIGAQMGSLQEEIANGIEDAQVKALPLTTSLLVDLKTKKLDAIIMEQPVAVQYAKNNDDLAVPELTFDDYSKGAAIGVKLENKDLLEFVNETLDEMKQDKTIEKFVQDAIELSNSTSEQ